MRFEQAVEFVLDIEKENSFDTQGGFTRWGIAQNFHPEVDVRTLTREGAIVIYKSQYWDRCRCDELPDGLRLAVFDAAVNPGPGMSIRFLQRAIGAVADGIIGPKTLAAAAKAGSAILPEVLAERILHFGGTEGFTTNGRGWIRRCLKLEHYQLTH